MENKNFRALLNKRFHIPKERSIQRAITRFTSAEKALFYGLTSLLVMTSIVMLLKVNNAFLIRVPIRGGSLTEGVVGNPRFVNPVLAISEADKSLVSLIYSGLVRIDVNGNVRNDLAESITVSEDGLTYEVTLRSDAIFHDDKPITADDVVFTIQKILDPNIKSPQYGDFAGVSINKVDEHKVSFSLRKPYSPFIKNLTVGILPKHIWSTVTDDEFSFSQWNVLPIGSGPYMVEKTGRDGGGIPNYYDLIPFDEFLYEQPFISHYIFKFYSSETDMLEAYDGGEVDILGGISPDEALTINKNRSNIINSPLPRIFGVFFNQNANKVLLDKTVRNALDTATPKEEILKIVLNGFGKVIDGPLPPMFSKTDTVEQPKTASERLELASSTLANAGWVKNKDTGILEKKNKNDTIKLSFSISTSDNPDLEKVAKMLEAAWTSLGAEVKVSIYESGDLNQNVIRPRKYETLLFGEVIGKDGDAFPFWHSSERNDPGLNIALYVNNQVDKLLESIRSERDEKSKENLYLSFEKAIKSDIPAVFLYSPDYIYVIPDRLKGISLKDLSKPEDRYRGVRDWYVETNSVWKVFQR